MILAGIYDSLVHLNWALSKIGSKGAKQPHPKSLCEELRHKPQKTQKEKDTAGFASGNDFDVAWRQMIGETDHG